MLFMIFIYIYVRYDDSNNSNTWGFLDSVKFSINKTKLPFPVIGSDHVLEQGIEELRLN